MVWIAKHGLMELFHWMIWNWLDELIRDRFAPELGGCVVQQAGQMPCLKQEFRLRVSSKSTGIINLLIFIFLSFN